MTRFLNRADGDEAGLTLIELMAALSVLAVGFMSLAGAMGLGLKLVGLGRQRQSAAEVGNARVEHLRNISFEDVALAEAPAHVTDDDHPDFFVSLDGTQYDYSGSETYETLVIRTSPPGLVQHVEDPVSVGTATFRVYQYVTWANTGHTIKRVTVVIQYRVPAAQGISKIVRVSSLFTAGTVNLDGDSPGAQVGSNPAPPAPTPGPTGSCAGDQEPPDGDFTITTATSSDGQNYTNSPDVTADFSGLSDPCSPISVSLSNDGILYGQEHAFDPLNPTVSWTLSSDDGSKSVRAKVRDNAGNEAIVGPVTLVLDTTRPSLPGSLARTVSCSGAQRTVTMSWGSSTDTNLRGYRVWKSVDNAPWVTLSTVTTTSKSDTDLKTYDSVRYVVQAYDKAGNVSEEVEIATIKISLAKNQCS